MKRGKLRVTEEKDALAKRVAELEGSLKKYQTESTDKENEDARKKGDVQKLDSAWQKKYDADIKARDERLALIEKQRASEKRESIVKELADKIALPQFTHLVQSDLLRRINVIVDERTGKLETEIVDEYGKLTKSN